MAVFVLPYLSRFAQMGQLTQTHALLNAPEKQFIPKAHALNKKGVRNKAYVESSRVFNFQRSKIGEMYV